MIRRRFLGLAAAPVALLLPSPALAEEWDGHLEIHQRTGLKLLTPHGRAHHVMVWPEDSPVFPPPPGWISIDRTEIALREPGCYRLDWRLTYSKGGGRSRKTAAEYWDGSAWRDLGDGNELPPTRGTEVTLIGWAFCRSDGSNKVRILDWQDSGGPLETSDRNYEAACHVTRL